MTYVLMTTEIPAGPVYVCEDLSLTNKPELAHKFRECSTRVLEYSRKVLRLDLRFTKYPEK